MAQKDTKREKYLFHNTLTGLIKGLERKHTVIDLRNESCVSGLIKNVDGYMNIEMQNVTFYDPHGREFRLQDFFVSARNIRYVHIPDDVSPEDLLRMEFKSQRRVPQKHTGRTFKSIRANRYTQQIIDENYPGPSNA